MYAINFYKSLTSNLLSCNWDDSCTMSEVKTTKAGLWMFVVDVCSLCVQCGISSAIYLVFVYNLGWSMSRTFLDALVFQWGQIKHKSSVITPPKLCLKKRWRYICYCLLLHPITVQNVRQHWSCLSMYSISLYIRLSIWFLVI